MKITCQLLLFAPGPETRRLLHSALVCSQNIYLSLNVFKKRRSESLLMLKHIAEFLLVGAEHRKYK